MTVVLYYDDKKVATQDGASKEQCETYAVMDEIDLEAVCYKPAKGDDGDEGPSEDDESSEADEDFDPDGETIEDGEEVDDDDNGDDNGDDGDDLDDGDERASREGKFRVHNYGKRDVKVDWRVESDKQGGKLSIPAKDAESVWVTLLDDQKTSLTLSYEGKTIATKKADTDTKCDGDCTDDH